MKVPYRQQISLKRDEYCSDKDPRHDLKRFCEFQPRFSFRQD
jgi:hypothetical protein